MKTYKKIGLGLGIVIAALCFSLLKSPARALAFDAQSQSDIQALIGTLVFQDRTTITGSIGGTKISFVDNDITDGTYNYKPPDGSFCKTGGTIDGITLTGNPFAGGVTTVNATVDLDISPDGTAGSCVDTKPNKLPATIGQVANRLTTFEWSGNDLTQLSSGDTFSHTGDTSLFEKNPADGCGGGDVVILNSGSTTSGTEYILSKSGLPNQRFDNPHFTNSTCYLISSRAITISGTKGATSGGGGGGGGTQDGTQPDTCELSSNGFSLAWLMCPLLLAGEEISNNLINAFENELSFNVNQDLGNKNSQASVEKTWSLFKNIATAILVILMLLMVFSQAISAGPFDAYTVRKMLPRLVVVAIAIQLSWPLVSFVIDTFDHIGRGIADIMYFSFGGADALSLGHILNNANIGTATAATVNWVVLVGTIGLGIAALPALLLLLLATGAAILTAVITLVLRKIIIILLLMLAPVALLAYVLPGTQRYWKLWIDNLIKILAMFPLVVALVAAGRIFAFIVGTQDNTQFLNFIFICIGFFGPLFFLPKTFKWGGQLMSATANGVASATNRFVGKESALGKGVQGYGERKQGEWAKAYNPNEKSRFKRGFQRVQSGHAIPFSKRSQRLAIASGDKWSQERDEEALALIKRKGEKVMREGYEAAVLTDDKTGFARYKTDAQGNRLGKDNRIAYNYAGKDDKGGDVYKIAGTDEIATNFDDADKERVDSYDQASKRTMTGVAAMKQMWVDLSDEGRDKHERKMAIRQLTATSSWPELQGNLSRRGNKAIDVEDWSDSITTSPEDYPRVLRSRVDATPHIDRGARDKLAAAKVSGRTFDTPQQEKDFISANRVSYGIADQMSNEDFQTQSEGFWQETSRVANLKEAKFVTTANPEGYTPEAIEVRDNLKARFQSIKEIGGTAPQQLLGHLMGGSIEKRVNEALGPDDSVRNYVVRGAGGQQQPPAGGNPANPGGNPPTNPPGGGETMSDDGTIDLHPDE
jgi:hypothetical protein